MTKLTRDFFLQPTLEVAQNLLGKEMVFGGKRGVIYETEAYIGQDDPACHAAKGLTLRTKVMFGLGGHSYVYLIYGMYHCLNFVTEVEGFPAAVLIRGVWLPEKDIRLNGPGKVCQYFGISRMHNAVDIVNHSHFYVTSGISVPFFTQTPRIGIRQGLDKLWRFVGDITSAR